MKAWFISDIHLKELNERNGNILLRFLLSLQAPGQRPTHLFLLGDIFDMWAGNHDFYYKKFQPIVDVIVALKQAGVEVIYFEGNHDIHVKKFWNRLGIHCYVDEQYFELGPYRVRVEHGDMINLEDLAYMRYRRAARQPLTEMLIQNLPPVLFSEFGRQFSRISRKFSMQKRRDQESELRSMIHQHAERAYSEKAFDYIISGHMHVKDEYKFEQDKKTIQSINLGSWFDEPKALLLTEQGHTWNNLD